MNKATKTIQWGVRAARILPLFFLFLIAGTEGAGWGFAGVGFVIAIAGIVFNQNLKPEDRIVW